VIRKTATFAEDRSVGRRGKSRDNT
jgi:hypothetical protein